jgi:hypothetical protein
VEQAIVELIQLGIFFSENADELHVWRSLKPHNKAEWLELNGYNPKLITILAHQDIKISESIDGDLLNELRLLLIDNTIGSILQGRSSSVIDRYISEYHLSGGRQSSTQSNGPVQMHSRYQRAKYQEKELREASIAIEQLKKPDNALEHRLDFGIHKSIEAVKKLDKGYRLSKSIQFSKSGWSSATKEINEIANRKIGRIFREQRKELGETILKSVSPYQQRETINGKSQYSLSLVYGHALQNQTYASANLSLTLYSGKIDVSINIQNNDTGYRKTLSYEDGSGSIRTTNNWQSSMTTTYFTNEMATKWLRNHNQHFDIVQALRNKVISRDKHHLAWRKSILVQSRDAQQLDRTYQDRGKELSAIRKVQSTRKRLQREYNFVDKQFGSLATIEGIYKQGRSQLNKLFNDTRREVAYWKNASVPNRDRRPSKYMLREEYKSSKSNVDRTETAFRSGGWSFTENSYKKFEKENNKHQGRKIRAAFYADNDYYLQQKNAYVAGKKTYQTAIESGDTKRQARNLATLRFFDVRAAEDIHDLSVDLAFNICDFTLPLSIQRQRRAAERILFLDRHPFAWQARLSFNVWRASMIDNLFTKADNYANSNDLGFMPWRRTKRFIGHTTSLLWHGLGFIFKWTIKPATYLLNKTSGLWGGHLGTRYKNLSDSVFHLTGTVGHLVGHGLLNLPNRLVKDTRVLSHQLIRGLMHPFDEKGHLDAFLRDTRGIRHTLKTLGELAEYGYSEAMWVYTHPKEFISGNQVWSHGLFHKHLHKELKIVEFGVSLMGILPYQKALKTAIRVDTMKRSLKTAIHRQTGLLHPNKRLLAIPLFSALLNDINEKVDSLSSKQELRLVQQYHKIKKDGNWSAVTSSPLVTEYKQDAATEKQKIRPWVDKNIDSKSLKSWTKHQLEKDYRQTNAVISLDRYAHANKKQTRLAERDAYVVYKYQPYSQLKQIKTYKSTLNKTLENDWKTGGGKYEFQGFKNYVLFTSLAGNKNLRKKATKNINNNSYGYHMFTDIVLAYALSDVSQSPRLLATKNAVGEMVSAEGKSTKKALIDYRKYLIHTQKLTRGTLAAEKTTFVSVRKKYRNISRLRAIGSLEIDPSSVSFLLKQWTNETLLNPIVHKLSHHFSFTKAQVEAYNTWISYNRTEGNMKNPKRGLQTAFKRASSNEKSDLYYTTSQMQTEYHNWDGEPVTVGQLVKTLFKPTTSWEPIVLPSPKLHKRSANNNSKTSNDINTPKAENSVQLLQYYNQLKFVKHLFSHKKKAAKKAKNTEDDATNISSKDKEILEDNINSVDAISEDIGVIEKNSMKEVDSMVDQQFKEILDRSLDNIIENTVKDASRDLTREATKADDAIDDAIDDEIDMDEAVGEDLVEIALL